MKKKLFICFLLIGSLMGSVMAQGIITHPLLFVFKLHGQTRKYQFTFSQSNDTLYLHWGIERNTRWQSGSYAMPQEALKTAAGLSFLQPEDGRHICLPAQETFALLSATAYQELKSQKEFHYNQTEYRLADTKSQAMGYPLLHVNDSVDGCEMWIMDNPDFPLIWEIQNNPLGINWKAVPVTLPVHHLKKEEIMQSPEKMGSIYYAYPTPDGIRTPAPEGYSPFYVSHYGRHGSRWMTSDERYLEVIRVFDTFHEKSGLTALGEDVRLRLQKVWENARGRGGDLTSLGERQHKAIARRLYQQYPQIFRDSACISARSSTSVRCIMSMSAFSEQLKELNPSLRITREANRRYMDYIAYTSPELEEFSSDSAAWRTGFRCYEESHIRPERLTATLFTNPQEVKDPRGLMMGLYWIASDMQDVELPLSFYDLFEKEELFNIWQSINYRMYICNANAPLNGGVAPESAKSLLKNIIESADHAIRKGTPCATLRFGHDTNLIRLLALMQVEGCSNQETDPDRYYLAWQDFRISPMGANLQLIFFKNGQGEVIVKLLHNENEVKLPIDSPIAPYYQWEAVKAFYNHL